MSVQTSEISLGIRSLVQTPEVQAHIEVQLHVEVKFHAQVRQAPVRQLAHTITVWGVLFVGGTFTFAHDAVGGFSGICGRRRHAHGQGH